MRLETCNRHFTTRDKGHDQRESVMHSHPESIAVFLTDAHARFTYPDEKSEDIKAKAGSVQHMDAFTHLPENTSKKSFEVIQVELK
jgi:hypothetical protein